MKANPAVLRESVDKTLQFIEQGKLKGPHVSAVFGLEQVRLEQIPLLSVSRPAILDKHSDFRQLNLSYDIIKIANGGQTECKQGRVAAIFALVIRTGLSACVINFESLAKSRRAISTEPSRFSCAKSRAIWLQYFPSIVDIFFLAFEA